MFLKSLVIKGFKSFADKAVLDLEPGITVVVGPNGSGKSNVVDAIAWVLGAQAPTAVRSQRMDDVIFAGTSGRAALGRAEVALTIDNSDGYLPVEFTEVTVSRTLFRSGDSAYAINGTSCRLLDIHELLSDAGVGRTQHVIASQGQLDAILNARPEERRTIIEEAAGVLKHRRRRERSERRLLSAEANLTRVNDLLREVRRQLRPLERQAEAARRHELIQAELLQLRTWLAARELAALDARVAAVAAKVDQLAGRSRDTEIELAGVDAEIAAVELRLRTAGTRALTDALARAERVRERARGTAAVLRERRRALERELARADDRSALVVLDGELERAHGEEQAATAASSELEGELAALGEAEEAVRAERDALVAEHRRVDAAAGTTQAEGQAELAALRREAAGLHAALTATEGELARLDPRRQRLGAQLERGVAEAERLEDQASGSETAEDDLARAVVAAERTRAEAEAAGSAAEVARREAEADWRGWGARAEALAQALDAVRARAGAERLAGHAGVLGTLLDVVDVDPGWEVALEAAAGEALEAVVVLGPTAALAALDVLREDGRPGSVLAAGLTDGRAATTAAARVPDGVRAHVRARGSLTLEARAGVDSVLDLLVGGVRRIDGGWSALVAAARAHPAASLVSPEGDRFAPTGWRLGRAAAGATAALVEEAEGRAAAARVARDDAAAVHKASGRATEDARRAHQAAVRAADAHTARVQQRAGARATALRQRDEARAELAQLDAQAAELTQRQGERQERVVVVRAALVDLEAAEAEARTVAASRREALADLERRGGELARRRAGFEARQAAGVDRATALARRRAELRRQLDEATASVDARQASRDDLVRRGQVADQLAGLVHEDVVALEQAVAALAGERDRVASAARAEGRQLDGLRQQRAGAEKRLAELGELSQRAAIESAELTVRREAAEDAARRTLGALPAGASDGADGAGRIHEGAVLVAPDPPPLPEGVEPAARVRELERELRLLGPINPLAVEEHAALAERHDFLGAQLADVKDTRRDLAKVIKAIDDEIATTFAAAFADVAHHFRELFSTLFPGGQGELRLTDPDDLLDTGIEVEARPSGKNVRKLSLLSGGERSLTALGLLFAIFRSRPSPFYVLDEVEAALDDVNLRRFLDLLEAFRSEAQLLVVSHQKRTMEIADSLYGVTLRPGGSSTVVSERLRSG